MKQHVSHWKNKIISSEDLQKLLEESEELAVSRNLRYSLNPTKNDFSFYYYGEHPFPQTWKIRHLPTMRAFDANYFAPISEAVSSLTTIEKYCPDSRLVKQFLQMAKLRNHSPQRLFNGTFLTENINEISEPFLRYLKGL